MANNEGVYYTPEGYVDLPFLYVFDASSLTDGTTPPTQHVPIQWDSDFVLRSILGGLTVTNPAGGGIRLYNYSGSQATLGFVSPFSNVYPVAPEKVYPANGAIRFDLQNVLRASAACGLGAILSGLLAFQGVKRYKPGSPGYASGGPQVPPPYDPAKYIPRLWTYRFFLNLNWFKWVAAGVADIPRTFTVEIQDYDFELHYITVANALTGAALTTDLFQILLYDATAKRSLSSVPVNQSFINNNRTAYSNPVFPVPPLLYPVWTQIRFDITSLVCNTDVSAPYGIEICFVGVNRTPRVGSTSGDAGKISSGGGKATV